jgi:Domain of unknown function (DUF4407)/CHAT domain
MMRTFLLRLSGVRPEPRERRPGQRVMPELLGLAVLVVGGLAAVSLWLALTGGLGLNPLAAVAPALAGGLIVVAIERWLVSPVPSGGRRRLVRVIPRVVAALLLAALISTPIALRIFQSDINARATAIAQQRAATSIAQAAGASDPQVSSIAAEVANLHQVIDSKGQAALDPATDLQLASLKNQQAAALAQQQQDYQQCQSQSGQGCAGDAGDAGEYQQAVAQVEALNNAIHQREKLLTGDDTASRQARYQEAVARLPAAQQQLNAAVAQLDQSQQAVYRQNQAASGLSTKLQALGDLSGHDVALNLALFLLFLAVLMIVCLPVTGVLRLQPAGYAGIPQVSGRPPGPAPRRPRTAWAPSMFSSARPAADPAAGAAIAVGPSGAAGGDGAQPAQRYLKAQCPESVPVGKAFSLMVRIVAAGPAGVALKAFDVPAGGRDVLLVVHAPGLRLLGDQRLTVRVPAEGDSEPVMFELRSDQPGPRSVSVSAWLGGSYLGELAVEITAERNRRPGPHHDVFAEIDTEPTGGAVSLVVRYDSDQNAYRFEFRDEDNPEEVTNHLAYDPKPLVEQLVAELDDMAKGRVGYSPAQAWRHLVNSGANLWNELVPEKLREQFWDRQDRISQLTILTDKDAVPWELLYPLDPGRDAGFLVEQFPVTRAIFGRRPARGLSLRPARFVLPAGSLPEAADEIDAMRRLLAPGQPPDEVISALTPLQDLIDGGNFGLLHFACHNRFDPVDGSSITLDNVPFKPGDMRTAVVRRALGKSAPTVFINACRSAGFSATYNRLDGWASQFLQAGAAAFIGSLWAVSDGAAREFAGEFYARLQAGSSLGGAVHETRRQMAAGQADDPTWLAYTVYGDPRATVSQRS